MPPVVWSCSVRLANVMKTDVVWPDGQAKVPGSAGEALSVTWPVILPLWSTWKVPLPEAGGPGIVILLEAFGLFPPPLTQKYVVVIELAVAVTTSESPTFPSPDSVKLTVRTALKVVEVAVAPLSAAALEAPDEVAAAVVDVGDDAAGVETAATAPEEKPAGKGKSGSKDKAKAKGKAAERADSRAETKSESQPESSAAGPVKLLVRLYFSDHEKLSEQRWIERIPNDEHFRAAAPKVIRLSDTDHASASERFDALD